MLLTFFPVSLILGLSIVGGLSSPNLRTAKSISIGAVE